MNLYIPAIGTKMVLTEPWTFKLWYEDRNSKFIDALDTHFYNIPAPKKHDRYWAMNQELCDFTLPTGTQLSLARIYVRLGQKQFDSVTFNASWELISPKTQKLTKIKGRFWVKLADANTIKMEVLV